MGKLEQDFTAYTNSDTIDVMLYQSKDWVLFWVNLYNVAGMKYCPNCGQKMM